MCCNAHSKAASANDAPAQHVDEQLVATPLPDGYWLHAFPYEKNAKLPDLIGYGLGFAGKPASIKLFENPKNTKSEGWKVTEIQSMDFPVAMAYADISGNGHNDVIICDRYGPSMSDLWDAKTQDGGRIQWLENPGDRSSQPYWKAHHIGNSTVREARRAMCSCFDAAGHFTSSIIQIMGLPIIPASGDLISPAPVLTFTPTDKSTNPGRGPWTEEVAFAAEFHLIHEAVLIPGANDGLDMVIVAGREGTVLLWFDQSAKKWCHNVIGTGLPETKPNPYWGSGSVDLCKVGDDPVGYVATCEAFHGNTVAVYIKDANATKGPASLKENIWKRVELDNFGPLDEKGFTGTIHNVRATKIGDDKFDSFAIACMGAPVGKAENQGVYVYIPTDLANGKFERIKVSDESAGRLAIAGFTHHDKQEIGSISYYVPGYHTGPDPPSIRINDIQSHNLHSRTAIFATKLNKEVLLRVPRPSIVPEGCIPQIRLMTIGGKMNSIVVLRPGSSMKLGNNDGAKVIYGTIEMKDANGKITIRGIAPAAKEIGTSRILSPDGYISAGDKGAVFILVEAMRDHFQGPYRAMSEIPTTNQFPRSPQIPSNVRAMNLPFILVDDLAWAQKPNLWKDFEFYNFTGFHVYFNDDAMEEICHMQAWTLGLGETARFHNHSDKSFCEIHYCLSNGEDGGSMRYFADDDIAPIDTSAELTKEYVEQHAKTLIVPTMCEHGPLWKIKPGTKATPLIRANDTVDYPWHAWLASRFGDFKLPHNPPLTIEQQKFDLWLA
ncbi:hypothetical protein HWV62_16736 [Athelia sp. TMB]|nr:hypothetical protein HWV62_16736 [Athelia sp. TMB]